MAQTLYEKLGGEGALSKVVTLFYGKLMADALTRPFFEGLDLRSLIRKQTAFMARVLGGPADYQGRDLRTAHAKLVIARGLTDVHFDAMASHLGTTLREVGVTDEVVRDVLSRVDSLRGDVLGRPRAR